MHKNIFDKSLEYIYNKFKNDTSKMLVVTGTVGWGLSSAAQIVALLINDKISTEKKSFLIPQEFMDAVINVGGFFLITSCAKKYIAKLVSTGKFAPQSVRNYLEKNKDLYKDKVGKLDFKLDDVLSNDKTALQTKESYEKYKNFVTTVGTVGASILSCNIVTPVLRNSSASYFQKCFIENKKQTQVYPQNTYYNANMKV